MVGYHRKPRRDADVRSLLCSDYYSSRFVTITLMHNVQLTRRGGDRTVSADEERNPGQAEPVTLQPGQ